MSRDLLVAIVVVALGGGAWLWANLSDPTSGPAASPEPRGAKDPGPTGAVDSTRIRESSPTKVTAQRPVAGPDGRVQVEEEDDDASIPPPNPRTAGKGPAGASDLRFEDLPAVMQPDGMTKAADGLRRWLAEHPIDGLAVLEPDCGEAPCVLPIQIPGGTTGHAGPMSQLMRQAEEQNPGFTVVPMPQPGHDPPQMSLVWLPQDDPRLSTRIRSLAMRRVRMQSGLPGGIPPGTPLPVAPPAPD